MGIMGIVLIMGNVGFISTTVGFEVLIVLRLQLSPCFGVGDVKNRPWTAMQHAYQIAGFVLSRPLWRPLEDWRDPTRALGWLGLRKVRDQTLILKCH